MKEAFAVTGFVSDARAEQLAAKGKGPIQVKPERGVSPVVMEVDSADVVEVRTGASRSGETLVQLILRDQATVRTIIESKLTEQGISPFADPAIVRLTAAATVKSIIA